MAQPTPATVIKTATRTGVAVQRYRITREQADELKKIECSRGKPAATAALLRMLWPKAEF